MKISFLIGSMDSGGAERVVSILSNKFSGKHDIIILTWSNNDSFYGLKNKIYHKKLSLTYHKNIYYNNIIFNIVRLFKLVKALKQNKPDILISFIISNNVLAIIAGKILGIPVVISERSELFTKKITACWFKLRGMTYSYAQLLVLQTEEAKQLIFKNKLQAQKNVVINNPVINNEEVFVEKENVILYVGRLSAEKRVSDLIEAFCQTKTIQNDYVLWIVGDGPEMNNLLALSKKLSIASKIIFWGKQSLVKDFYQKAKIFVLPSISEGFPNVLLEAISFKNIVISSNCSMGPKEIIEDGVDGFLYEPKNVTQLKDILLNVTVNYNVLGRIINAASNKLKKYSVDTISGQWESYLDEILNSKSR